MLRILIADNYEVVREGVKTMLAQIFTAVSFGEAPDRRQALILLHEQQWDLVLLHLAAQHGINTELLQEIKRYDSRLGVVVLSLDPDTSTAVRALKSGASAYLTNELTAAELGAAVKQALRGGKYISAAFAEKLADAMDESSGQPLHEMLSERELQTVCRLASGKTVKQTAEESGLSIKTIATYRARALKKLRMKTNAELTFYCIKNHLVH